MHRLLLVLFVELLQERDKVFPIIGDSSAVIGTRIFLYTAMRICLGMRMELYGLTQSKSTPSKAYWRMKEKRFSMNLALFSFVLTMSL